MPVRFPSPAPVVRSTAHPQVSGLPDSYRDAFPLSRGCCPDAHPCPAAAIVVVCLGVGEAVLTAAVSEGGGLLGSPAVTGQARSTRLSQPFDGHQPAAGLQHPPGLSQPCVKVGPMVHGGDGPSD